MIVLKNKESDYNIDKSIQIISGNIKNKNIFRAVSYVENEIKTLKPDIVMSFMTKSNLISLIAGKRARHKCPVVISERANPFYSTKIFSILKRKIYPMASGCVFQTKAAQDYYKDILKCESIIIRNPLSPDFKIEPYHGKRDKKIVCTARLSEEKNQQLLINAFASIKDKYKDYRLEIYGEGPERDNLQNLIDKLNVNDRVKLMGRHKNIIEKIQDASIFVLPSNSEGMPNALLEAVALGIPSIATDCPIGGSAIIIKNNENGILIPMNDKEALISAIEKIINDSKFAKKISENGTKIVDDFETTKVCKEWEEYLKKVKENYYG